MFEKLMLHIIPPSPPNLKKSNYEHFGGKKRLYIYWDFKFTCSD